MPRRTGSSSAVATRADADREETVRRAQEMVQAAEQARAAVSAELETLRAAASSDRTRLIEEMRQVASTQDWFAQKGRHQIYAGNRPVPLPNALKRKLPLVAVEGGNGNENGNGQEAAQGCGTGCGCAH